MSEKPLRRKKSVSLRLKYSTLPVSASTCHGDDERYFLLQKKFHLLVHKMEYIGQLVNIYIITRFSAVFLLIFAATNTFFICIFQSPKIDRGSTYSRPATKNSYRKI